MWGVIFSYGGVLGGGGLPPSPRTRLTKNCVGTHAPPHGRTKKFSEGGGQSQKASHKDEKRHKDKKPPTPTWRKK